MADTRTPWQVITGNPLRFLVSPWPWRALAYLLTTLPSGIFVLLVNTVIERAELVTGVIIVLVIIVISVPVAFFERRRLRLIDPVAAPSPHRPSPYASRRARLKARLTTPATWREAGYTLLWATVLPVVDFLAVLFSTTLVITGGYGFILWLIADRPLRIIGTVRVADAPSVIMLTSALLLVGLIGGAYLLTLLAAAQGALARSLLTVPPEERMTELTRSRARLVDAFEAERRRIERDLHDGAQLRLTAVLMQLGLARLDVHDDPERTARAIDAAYDHAQAAVHELRGVIRGIHPATLTDRGLAVAVAELARHCQIPVRTDIDLPERPPPGVEAAAYFCVSECLTNVVKHSRAGHATLKARRVDGRLVLEVGDDGIGGADPAAGSGITGLADRIGVLDGVLSLSSPAGGPTMIRVEIPCD
ncbi:sensor domain-containing protein [Streptosporangium sp. NPDC000396]|uniref:sensor histidine kinase n=1 Tax=Streptosporangium sp. NPDC000396 TaxID=3366185 RepID=UPI003693021D